MIEKSRQLFPGPKPPADQPDEEQAQTHGQFGVPNPASLPNDYQQSTEETESNPNVPLPLVVATVRGAASHAAEPSGHLSVNAG